MILFYRILSVSGITLCLYLVQYLSLYIANRPSKKKSKNIIYWDSFKYGQISSSHVSDHYSIFNLLAGIGLHYFTSALLGPTREQKFLLALITQIVLESAVNNPFFLDSFGSKLFDTSYSGDTVLNSVMDTVWFMTGNLFAVKLPYPVLLGMLGVLELYRGVYLRENVFSIVLKMKNTLLGLE